MNVILAALKEMEQCFEIANTVKAVTNAIEMALEFAQFATIIEDIVDVIRMLPKSRMSELEKMTDAAQACDSAPEMSDEEMEKFCDDYTNEWKEDVSKQINNHIEEVVKPLLKKGLQIMVDTVGSQIKKAISKI